ncbi:class I SAM-dependent methyltransferase [Streptosporangium sp. CA-135522]|uniref:class I SAM-dependent methyltransferase n=1 Tax=Streptosporangium sp. CA-135522 TaxID=3240072 RepID=UPI003D91763D
MIGQLYERSLAGAAVEIEYADGRTAPLDSARWLTPIDGDEAMLARCDGPTLDVGSGPGRLTVALARRGVPALGVDVAPYAVHLTRRAGGRAICRNVFERLPGHGRWATALLADGNIGIGGDPDALLRRVRELVRPGGEVIAEVEPPGTAGRVERVRLRGRELAGAWFGWATVSVSDLGTLAWRNGFACVDSWKEAGRWFASLR